MNHTTVISLSNRKRGMFRLLLLGVLLFLVEGLSFVPITLSSYWLGWEILRTPAIFDRQSKVIESTLARGSQALTVFDAQLGWRLKPGAKTPVDQINAQGLRSSREYTPVAADGITRVSVFGDSFVYCTEVADKDAWPALVEQMYPDLEVLNYGVPAYGPDQAYLRFAAEASALSPHIVILGISPVSLDRSVSVYRGFLTHGESTRFLVKPRFALDHDAELLLLPNPLARISDARKYLSRPGDIIELGEHDYWYEPDVFESRLYDYSATLRLATALCNKISKRYLDPDRTLTGPRKGAVFNQSSAAFRIVAKLVERFAQETESMGALPIILVLPDRYSLRRTQQGVSGICTPLVRWCNSAGFRCLDLSDAFAPHAADAPIDAWFAKQHYSPSGNKIIASWLGEEIGRMVAASKGA